VVSEDNKNKITKYASKSSQFYLKASSLLATTSLGSRSPGFLMRSGLKWCMIATKARPSLKEDVRSVISTQGYEEVTREHQIWRARMPLR
jgi:hypothetical protein